MVELRVVSRSLSHDVIVVPVYVFVTSRVDHCCSLLVGIPLRSLQGWIWLRDLLLDIIGPELHVSYVTAYNTMCDILHSLPVSQQISFLVAALETRCAPSYLFDLSGFAVHYL